MFGGSSPVEDLLPWFAGFGCLMILVGVPALLFHLWGTAFFWPLVVTCAFLGFGLWMKLGEQ